MLSIQYFDYYFDIMANNLIVYNMQKKYIPYLLLAFVLITLTIFLLEKKSLLFNKEGSNISNTQESQNENAFLLEGYPIKEVPLYKLREVSSNKYYINFDPINISTFGDKNFSYYNVVFYTESSQSEFLEYYKNLFDEEIVEEYPSPDMVKGNIGKYRVTAAHYDSNDTAYIQVYLPNEEFTEGNMYFDPFPSLFEEDSMFIEHENSYGLLNQLGGQIEYTKYFTVIDSGDQNKDGEDDVDEFSVLIEKYEEKYKEKTEYKYDLENHLMSWEEDGYSVKVSFTRDHGRVYLNIRSSMDI
ncbi:MAG: hypothetical protein RBS01_03955 [Candidatus Dojkabacteria bacterium]|jgi:hypothetical protein|nr:hypothetical protein [Candidatus Dojkabacteria bacterium]